MAGESNASGHQIDWDGHIESVVSGETILHIGNHFLLFSWQKFDKR